MEVTEDITRQIPLLDESVVARTGTGIVTIDDQHDLILSKMEVEFSGAGAILQDDIKSRAADYLKEKKALGLPVHPLEDELVENMAAKNGKGEVLSVLF